MKVVALIMAGGRGTGLRGLGEKPLVKIGGKTMLERIVNVLKKAKGIQRIIVAVSKDTRRTAQEARRLALEIVETPGKGYVHDMRYAIEKCSLGHSLVISADLPLINTGIIDKAVSRYRRGRKPALAIMVPTDSLVKIGIKPRYKVRIGGRFLTPSAINLLNGSLIDGASLGQEFLVVDEGQALINVNTRASLRIARSLLRKRA